MRERFDPGGEEPRQPWMADPDAWRGTAPASTPHGGWPQLAAGPAYWMWLEMLERERGLDA
jgi:hypothetical protein